MTDAKYPFTGGPGHGGTKTRTTDHYGRIYTTDAQKLVSAEPFVDRIGKANLTAGEAVHWWDFIYLDIPPEPETTYTSVSGIEDELKKHVDTVGATKTGDVVFPALRMYGEDKVWGNYARFHFDFFASQHSGSESVSDNMTWAELLNDWSGIFIAETTDETDPSVYIHPWFTFQLPAVDMSNRDFDTTLNKLGNFVEDAIPPGSYTGAALHSGVPYIAIKGYPERDKDRAPRSFHDRLGVGTVLRFAANMMDQYVGDNTGDTLDQYSGTP